MPAKNSEPIIDCDVHQRLKSERDLFPYLPRSYQQDIIEFGCAFRPPAAAAS